MAKNRLIVNLINRHAFTPRAWWRLTLILSMTLAYGAIFFPLHSFWGDGVSGLLLIPVMVSGWSFGPGFGLVFSWVAWLFNVVLWSLSQMLIWQNQYAGLAFFMLLVFSLVGYLTGRISILLNRRFLRDYAPGEAAQIIEQNHVSGNFEAAAGSLVNFMSIPAFAINKDRRVVAWNQGMEALSGLRANEILGKPSRNAALSLYQTPHDHLVDYILLDVGRLKQEMPEARQDGLQFIAEYYFPRLKAGGVFLRIKAAPLFDLDGNLVGAIQSMEDITENRREREINGKSNSYDSLTGLFTLDTLRDEIAEFENGRVIPTSIILIKLAASTTHPVENEVLVKRFVPFIRSVFRLKDTIAYLGDGEVAILLPRADVKVTQVISERLRKALTLGQAGADELRVKTNVVSITCQENGALYETFLQGQQALKQG